MKMIQSLLSPLLCVLALQFPLVAHAGASTAITQFHQTCDKTLATNNSGDQALGSCQQGQIAEKVYKNQKAAAVIYEVATGVAAAMAVLENTCWPGAKGVCLALDVAAVGKQFLDSSTLQKAGDQVVGSYASNVNSYIKTGAMGFGALTLKGMLFDGKKFSDLTKTINNLDHVGMKEGSKFKTGCIVTTVGLGIMTTAAMSATNYSEKALETAISTAKTQINLNKNTISYNLQNNQPQSLNNNPAAPNNNPAAEFSCDAKTGTAFAQCVGKTNPEIAALVNSPQAMDTLNKALGQNVGDFAKNYNGNSDRDLANYVGAGLGMSGDAVSGIMAANSKMAKVLGVPQEAYKPGAFASVNNGSKNHSGGVDPMEKMLADMMKNMADPGEDGLGAKRDPASEISFDNQMELLQPEQIAQRKDISLFDRAHYRIQKNLKNLEQLNWSERQ